MDQASEQSQQAGQPKTNGEGYDRADFQQLPEDNTPAADSGQANDVNLDVILDVSVTLSMEVGRARIPIRNLLQLNQGSVVELDRLAGEPLDVYVRLIDVVSPAERIRKLT